MSLCGLSMLLDILNVCLNELLGTNETNSIALATNTYNQRHIIPRVDINDEQIQCTHLTKYTTINPILLFMNHA